MDRRGQVTLEFGLVMVVAIPLLIGISSLVYMQWKRFKCAHITFRTAHAHLIGLAPPPGDYPVQVEENEFAVRATGYCGTVQERVELRRLEQFQF